MIFDSMRLMGVSAWPRRRCICTLCLQQQFPYDAGCRDMIVAR